MATSRMQALVLASLRDDLDLACGMSIAGILLQGSQIHEVGMVSRAKRCDTTFQTLNISMVHWGYETRYEKNVSKSFYNWLVYEEFSFPLRGSR